MKNYIVSTYTDKSAFGQKKTYKILQKNLKTETREHKKPQKEIFMK